jgi:hypothetical protein
MPKPSTWFADRVASMLPAADAAACVSQYYWNSCRYNRNYCAYYGYYGWFHCHLSCYGRAVCSPPPYTCCNVG